MFGIETTDKFNRYQPQNDIKLTKKLEETKNNDRYLTTEPTYASPSLKAIKHIKQKQKKSNRMKS
jgi:hypothetical protein